MDGVELAENPETGLYVNGGRQYLRCAFDEDDPIYIDVTGSDWSVSYGGHTHKLDFRIKGLSPCVREALRTVSLAYMKSRAPSALSRLAQCFQGVGKAFLNQSINAANGLAEITSREWLETWAQLNADARSTLRTVYAELAEKGLVGANRAIADEMKSWKARDDIVPLRDVLLWDPTQGALLAVETEIVRGALEHADPDESDADLATRIFGYICLNLLKRSRQILRMRADALHTITEGKGTHYFLSVPRVKAQTGRPSALWQIPEALALAIVAYSSRPAVRSLQKRFDRLIVMPSKSGKDLEWMRHGEVDAQLAKGRLQEWARKRGLISVRTGKPINLTPLRLRHTGATAMARQGRSRQEIQDVLEHDSPFSAQAYIDCLAADLLPVFEQSACLGDIFKSLADAYFFRGQIVDVVSRKPIAIPVVEDRPAIVGSCGNTERCGSHPFWACYNGCPHFLAFREGPHARALEHVEREFAAWNESEEGALRSKALKDFDRVGAAIREVIAQVESSNRSGCDSC